MAQYTAVTSSASGPVCTGVAVSSSDTISGNDVAAGAVLIVTCAATPSTVTLTDPGHTPAGSAATAGAGVVVSANTSRCFGLLSNYINASTNLVTVGYSATTNVTAMVVI